MQTSMTKLQLQAINKSTLQYPLDIAEKDYYLTLAIKLIAESPLASRVVFKGGTALHHCYLPQHRFSEDLDFTTPDKTLDADTVVNTLTRNGLFEVKKLFTSTATIKVERLRFPGVLAQPGAIEVEIERLQNTDCKMWYCLP